MTNSKKPKGKPNKDPIRVGNKVLIRTVTFYHTGRIIEDKPDRLILEDAAWIADTGRFNQALTNSTASEIEPFPSPIAVMKGSIIDVTDWRGELPRAVR